MKESFGIASFRSRQQVLKFESALRKMGLRVSVITTPRDVAVGCGLSLRFELVDLESVQRAYQQLRPTNLIGFYHVQRETGSKTHTSRL